MQRNIELQGVGTSPGVALGSVRLLFAATGRIEEHTVGAEGVSGEIARFQDALLVTRHQIKEIRQNVSESIDEHAAAIFDAHLLIIDDQSFIEKVIQGLRGRETNVEPVLRGIMEVYARTFSNLKDTYASERGADVLDLMNRILRNLASPSGREAEEPTGSAILVARDLPPSIAATLDTARIMGIATELGGHTSHAAIMARALEIPAVAGLTGIGDAVQPADVLLIDGTRGRVVVNPTSEQLAQLGHLAHVQQDLLEQLKECSGQPAQTRDGRDIRVCANLELGGHVGRVRDSGADGIGLFRTEFMFLSRPDLPSEDEQAAVYESVAQTMHPAPVVIRTLDIGGDKLLPHSHMDEQSASALGCRGIRLSLARPDVFKVQLRALLRAARLGNISLMYPMVSGVDEIRRANSMLREAAEELHAEGVAFGSDPPVGAMLEVPSAAMVVDLLAPEVAFFSLGTNDLVQYTIAVDRLEAQTAALYEPAHPGVLRLVKLALDAAAAAGLRISVCGEMAGSPLMLPLLMGLGATEISVASGTVPLAKHLVRSLRHADTEVLANAALKEANPAATLAACRKLLERAAPDLKELAFP